MLKRDNIAPLTRRAEVVAINTPEMAGDVKVQELAMPEWLAVEQAAESARDGRLFTHLLAASVVGGDDLPLLDATAWGLFAARNTSEFSRLIDVALKVNGKAPGDAKNG